MTFRFNSDNYSLSDAGRVLTCTHAETGFFTEGKRYPIALSDCGRHVCIHADDGDEIIRSSSTFTFSVMKPKQPKAGEVWSLRSGEFRDNSLYVVAKTDDEYVWNRHILGGGLHCERKDRFIERHTFVF